MEPVRMKQAIDACLARTEQAREAEAERQGVPVDDLDAHDENREELERRMEALERSGISLPEADIARIARSQYEETEPIHAVERWWNTRPDRPIFLMVGAVGVGKTTAAGALVAACWGGHVIHAPALARRVLPMPSDFAVGFEPVDLRGSLVVLDDLGTEPNPQNERWAEALSLFVERRMARGRTLITSNLSKHELGERYGERIRSRLNAHSYAMELKQKTSKRATGGGL